MGQWRGECHDLPVRFFFVIRGKSMVDKFISVIEEIFEAKKDVALFFLLQLLEY